MSEPSSIYAGDTVTWSKSLADYPAPTWTLTYSLVRDGASIIITATADGTDHLVTVPPSTTTEWSPGEHQWTAFVTDGASRYTIERGSMEILPDPAAGGYDYRSTARVMLDNIEAYLRDPTNLAASSYSIGGRSLSRWSRSELVTERSRLQMEVQTEKAADRMASGLGNPRRLYVRFDRG